MESTSNGEIRFFKQKLLWMEVNLGVSTKFHESSIVYESSNIYVFRNRRV